MLNYWWWYNFDYNLDNINKLLAKLCEHKLFGKKVMCQQIEKIEYDMIMILKGSKVWLQGRVVIRTIHWSSNLQRRNSPIHSFQLCLRLNPEKLYELCIWMVSLLTQQILDNVNCYIEFGSISFFLSIRFSEQSNLIIFRSVSQWADIKYTF